MFVGKSNRELHSTASSSSDSDAFMNDNDETNKLIETKEEQQEENKEIKIMIEYVEKQLKELSSSHSCYDIYRVPTLLCMQMPEAYIPQSVSIGPFHRNDEHLQILEVHKLQYLNCLLKRSKETFENCVQALSGLEQEARECYSNTMSLGKSEFVKMMVIDGGFILEYLETEDDGCFEFSDSRAMEIRADLIKLENQLPLFVLETLYALLIDPGGKSPFSDYIYRHLIKGIAANLNFPIHSADKEREALLRADDEAEHFLDFLRYILIPPSPRVISSNEKLVPLAYSASELKSAGVTFQKKENASLFDIDFEMKKGVLIIPTLKLYDESEVLLRNLIAFEQDEAYENRYFTAYAAFMDDLVATTKDVTLLTQEGIIVNQLGSPEDAVILFNNIVKHVVVGNPYFSRYSEDLNKYYNKSWNKWMANLRQTYFNTPWAGISVVAAVLVITLTMIQTICSLLQI